MKRKNYVYKLNSSNEIFVDLSSACQMAYNEIAYSLSKYRTLSQPIVTKIGGGYQVTVIDDRGRAYRRKVDVFVPRQLNTDRDFIKIAQRTAGKAYWLNDEEDY